MEGDFLRGSFFPFLEEKLEQLAECAPQGFLINRAIVRALGTTLCTGMASGEGPHATSPTVKIKNNIRII